MRASEKFIALALRARQKWIYKYCMLKRRLQWSTEDIKKESKCPIQIK